MNQQLIFTITLIVFTFGISQTTPLSWVWQSPKPQSNQYGNLCVINENIVFLVDAEGGTILKTTDGGITWNISYTPHPDSQPGYYELYSIDFPDAMTGYAVGELKASRGNITYPIILKTTDQGTNWTFQYTGGYGSRLYDVDFPQGNNQIGYAVGGWGQKILKTTNGGQTWNLQYSSADYCIHAVHFPVDANTGFAVGGNNATTPVLLKTTNGGSNWISMTSPANVTFMDVSFVDNQTGYAGGYVTSGGYGTIIKTTNGGNSWQTIWQYSSREIYAVHFIDTQTGYAGGWAGGAGFIMKTTDGGNSWNTVVIPKYIASGMKIYFANAQTGFAVGNVWDFVTPVCGQILKTTDAGSTWNFLNSGPEVVFSAVDFPENEQVGYVVGWSGYILKTTNGGIDWVQQSSGTGINLYDVDFLNNQLGFACGANGLFLKTTNGGNSWIPKNTNTTANLYAVRFVNDQIGYIGGRLVAVEGGVIYKTTDGGDNWTLQTLPNNESWRTIQDIFFFNADTGYAVSGAPQEYGGVVGLVYKTTNGGQTWVVNYTPTQNSNFYSIDFPVNSQIGYISGLIGFNGDYKMMKTTNGGASWFFQAPLDQGIVPAISVDFVDNLTGYAVFRGGGYNPMMKTTDGGTNWFAINSSTWHNYEDIFAINTNVVYGVGRGGMIRKTTNGGQVGIAEDKDDGNMNVDSHIQSLLVYPNPFRNNLHIRCRIHDTGYRIKIYDISGRVVKFFNLESCILNHESSITWFGDDNLGRELPAGVYFIVSEDKNCSPTRVVKIK
ncbi:MAG: YCF48-related protein [candidate division WOR-3 bacterium]